MNKTKKEWAEELLALRAKHQQQAQDEEQGMLIAKSEYELAQDNLRQVKVRLAGQAEGKNAEQREAWVMAQPQYLDALEWADSAREKFSGAYRAYKEQQGIIDYVRDCAALLAHL